MGEVRTLVVVLLAATIFGCGPSLRRTAQSRSYFERCYAADFVGEIAASGKHACWTAWIQHYAEGQPPDRVQYARQRRQEIEQGIDLAQLPGLQGRATTPNPSETGSANAAPTGDDPSGGSGDGAIEPSEDRVRGIVIPPTSNDECAAHACVEPFRACVGACGGSSRGCEVACRVEFQACARGCY